MHLPRFLSRPATWVALLLAWSMLLWWLSSQSRLPNPVKFQGVDKLQHAVYFAGGGTCFLLALRLAGLARRLPVALLATVLFCAAVGALDEWHQTFTPGRTGADVWDWVADTSGGLLGAGMALTLERWLRPRREER